MNKREFVVTVIAAVAPCLPAAAQGLEDVKIEATNVSGNVYMLTGRGGNMALCVGDDGAFLVDDQFAPLTERIVAAVGKITDKPIRFVVNTHWHGDHTGGNENLGKRGAILVAHDNVRKRLSTDQFMNTHNRTVPAAPHIARPVVTFAESITFHLNQETVEVIFVGPAHTDGDSAIYFKTANVMHTGDVFFNGMYPFIDPSSGGNIDGVVKAVDRILGLVNKDTKIIPGHGKLAGPKELREYRDMLSTVANRIHVLKERGTARADIIAAKPSAPFDEVWGGGFLNPDKWVGIVCDGLGIE